MSILELILAQDDDTLIASILHPFDRYSLALDLSDAGITVTWETVLAWETCGEVTAALKEKELTE